jgi:hypothetical protein
VKVLQCTRTALAKSRTNQWNEAFFSTPLRGRRKWTAAVTGA